MTDMGAMGHDPVKQRLAAQLSLYCGQGRLYSLDDLAAATNIPARTLKSYRDGQSEAPSSNLFRLMAVLPAAFSVALLAPVGLACHRREDEGACDFAVSADLAAVMAKLTDALRDGRVDHRERAGLGPQARDLAALLLACFGGEGRA